MTPKVLVLGGNFAGLTAAITLRRELGQDVDVTLLSKSSRFVFYPSLIWLPFGKRTSGDISVPIGRMLEARGIHFIHAEARTIDPAARTVASSAGTHDYDYLVVATGFVNDFDVVPGLGPGGNAYSITALDSAVDAAEGARFVNEPGPVVVATQGAACFGAAYEFAFNTAYQRSDTGFRSGRRSTTSPRSRSPVTSASAVSPAASGCSRCSSG